MSKGESTVSKRKKDETPAFKRPQRGRVQSAKRTPHLPPPTPATEKAGCSHLMYTNTAKSGMHKHIYMYVLRVIDYTITFFGCSCIQDVAATSAKHLKDATLVREGRGRLLQELSCRRYDPSSFLHLVSTHPHRCMYLPRNM